MLIVVLGQGGGAGKQTLAGTAVVCPGSPKDLVLCPWSTVDGLTDQLVSACPLGREGAKADIVKNERGDYIHNRKGTDVQSQG